MSAIDALPASKVEKVSGFITTPPYGVTDQPDFLNGCLRMKTLYYPKELLRELNRIEKEAGRERIIHWGPRTLDLDIIFYDDLISQEDDLCIPHVEMHNVLLYWSLWRKSHHTNGTREMERQYDRCWKSLPIHKSKREYGA